MSSATKVLILLVAIAAFAVGWVVNSAQVESEFDTRLMLDAELIESETPQRISRVQDKLAELNVVNFWASWCAPCRQEMPMFEAMYRQEQARGFNVIGIAIDSPSKTQAMFDFMGIKYQIL